MTKGIALINTLIISSLLSFLAIGFAFIMVSENKIAQAQQSAVQTHYLAEAGIQKAIWFLNNDWQNDFENGVLEKDLKLTNELYAGDEIKIEAKSTGQGEAWIESKAIYQQANRKIRTTVFKAMGDPQQIETQAVFSNNEVLAVLSKNIKISNDSLQANTNLDLMFFSKMDVAARVAAQSINIDVTSTLLAEEIIPNSPSMMMPALDFEKYKTKADITYSAEEFAVLLENNPVLNGIIYVTGSEYCLINIKRKQTLTINGFLLTDCALHLAQEGDFGYTNLIINHPANKPSGLATKKGIVINPLTSKINITGLLYSLGDIVIYGPIADFTLKGGLISQRLDIVSQLERLLEITYDEAIIKEALGVPQESPTIIIKHWEEEY